jgi:hypothetical protein
LEILNINSQNKRLEIGIKKQITSSILTQRYQATFDEAQKICEKDGMTMLSLETAAEASKIKDYINYIGNRV